MDNKENKYSNWVFTWNSSSPSENILIDTETLEQFLKGYASEYVYQKEIGENTERLHYQGCFKTKIRTRQQTVLNAFADAFGRDRIVHLTITCAKGTWDQCVAYCSKTESAVLDSLVLSKTLKRYTGTEISFLSQKENRYPWQASIIHHLYDEGEVSIKTPDDRSIIWIQDKQGNSGKSKLVKYLCFNSDDIVKISFGTAGQLRSSVISIGPRKVYIVDIPRTLGDDDSIPSLISSIEDIKNGYIVSSMYGKHQQLMMDPPHIIIFTNAPCPTAMMSEDRWQVYNISATNHLEKVIPWCASF